MTDRRHAKALAEVDRRDTAWFRSHPGRHFRVRSSVPFEQEDWGAGSHLEQPFMIVNSPHRDGQHVRLAIMRHKQPVNDETFLQLLFTEILAFGRTRDRTGEDLIEFSPEWYDGIMKMAGLNEGQPKWISPRSAFG